MQRIVGKDSFKESFLFLHGNKAHFPHSATGTAGAGTTPMSTAHPCRERLQGSPLCTQWVRAMLLHSFGAGFRSIKWSLLQKRVHVLTSVIFKLQKKKTSTYLWNTMQSLSYTDVHRRVLFEGPRRILAIIVLNHFVILARETILFVWDRGGPRDIQAETEKVSDKAEQDDNLTPQTWRHLGTQVTAKTLREPKWCTTQGEKSRFPNATTIDITLFCILNNRYNIWVMISMLFDNFLDLCIPRFMIYSYFSLLILFLTIGIKSN